ncbi:Uncharacterised protein [Gordonia paraffinivorans]|uniref:Uncharacterized protein n=1 Tax=Gordonia paraffinivorans TaxID=175628 RepID=A0ABD7UZI0_9ACTN|nr:Uncharacterised protein [Gordonia paraffinivorans]
MAEGPIRLEIDILGPILDTLFSGSSGGSDDGDPV